MSPRQVFKLLLKLLLLALGGTAIALAGAVLLFMLVMGKPGVWLVSEMLWRSPSNQVQESLSFSLDDDRPREERVAKLTRIVEQHLQPLPSKLLDAHFAEWQMGDDFLGPAEFSAYARLQVAPADIDAWIARFTPVPGRAESQPTTFIWPRPPKPLAWWPSQQELGTLEFFSPNALSSRRSGWIGVSREKGLIYLANNSS
jgi:hypothetical protein